MHLLLASHRYFPVPGGTERVVQSLAEGLARKGEEVELLTQAEPGVPAEERLNGVTIRRLPVRLLGGIRWPRGYLRELRRSGAELFHLHGNRIWCADFYFPWARLFRWPQVLTGYGFYQWAMHPRAVDRLYFRRYFPWAARGFDQYVPVTEHERDQLLGWGLGGDRMTVIPCGIDLEEFAAPPPGGESLRASWSVRAPNVAFYAGGFFENKRVDRLVEAVARAGPGWALVAAGRDLPGTPFDARHCRELAERRGVEFHAPGVLDRGDLLRGIFAADAVVLGSEYEGFGVLLLEAMAAGRPFVAFDAGAARELARGGAGFIATSVEEFASHLARLNDAQERRRAGELGRTSARAYSVESMVDRHRELYRRTLAR